MKIGIIILCRLSSTRLPGKILKQIEGKTILQHIHNRLAQIIPPTDIVIATSDEASDDPIETYCQDNKLQYYRGDLNNVALRFLAASEAFGFDYAVRINGDNIFIDLDTLTKMFGICQKGDFDFISNVKNRTYPYGMSIEFLRVDFYKKLVAKLTDKDYQEHVTLYLYHHAQYGKQCHVFNTDCPEANGLRFAVDEKKDFEFATKVMAQLKGKAYQYNLKELIEISEKL